MLEEDILRIQTAKLDENNNEILSNIIEKLFGDIALIKEQEIDIDTYIEYEESLSQALQDINKLPSSEGSSFMDSGHASTLVKAFRLPSANLVESVMRTLFHLVNYNFIENEVNLEPESDESISEVEFAILKMAKMCEKLAQKLRISNIFQHNEDYLPIVEKIHTLLCESVQDKIEKTVIDNKSETLIDNLVNDIIMLFGAGIATNNENNADSLNLSEVHTLDQIQESVIGDLIDPVQEQISQEEVSINEIEELEANENINESNLAPTPIQIVEKNGDINEPLSSDAQLCDMPDTDTPDTDTHLEQISISEQLIVDNNTEAHAQITDIQATPTPRLEANQKTAVQLEPLKSEIQVGTVENNEASLKLLDIKQALNDNLTRTLKSAKLKNQEPLNQPAMLDKNWLEKNALLKVSSNEKNHNQLDRTLKGMSKTARKNEPLIVGPKLVKGNLADKVAFFQSKINESLAQKTIDKKMADTTKSKVQAVDKVDVKAELLTHKPTLTQIEKPQTAKPEITGATQKALSANVHESLINLYDEICDPLPIKTQTTVEDNQEQTYAPPMFGFLRDLAKPVIDFLSSAIFPNYSLDDDNNNEGGCEAQSEDAKLQVAEKIINTDAQLLTCEPQLCDVSLDEPAFLKVIEIKEKDFDLAGYAASLVFNDKLFDNDLRNSMIKEMLQNNGYPFVDAELNMFDEFMFQEFIRMNLSEDEIREGIIGIRSYIQNHTSDKLDEKIVELNDLVNRREQSDLVDMPLVNKIQYFEFLQQFITKEMENYHKEYGLSTVRKLMFKNVKDYINEHGTIEVDFPDEELLLSPQEIAELIAITADSEFDSIIKGQNPEAVAEAYKIMTDQLQESVKLELAKLALVEGDETISSEEVMDFEDAEKMLLKYFDADELAQLKSDTDNVDMDAVLNEFLTPDELDGIMIDPELMELESEIAELGAGYERLDEQSNDVQDTVNDLLTSEQLADLLIYGDSILEPKEFEEHLSVINELKQETIVGAHKIIENKLKEAALGEPTFSIDENDEGYYSLSDSLELNYDDILYSDEDEIEGLEYNVKQEMPIEGETIQDADVNEVYATDFNLQQQFNSLMEAFNVFVNE